jgi:hypothetical protein
MSKPQPPEQMREIPYLCEVLLDQGRYIGDDPVGYACRQPAKWEYTLMPPLSYLLCDSCKNILEEDSFSPRITWPPFPKTMGQREDQMNELMARILND